MALNSTARAKASCFVLLLAWGYAAWPMLFNMFKTYGISGYDYQGFFALPLFFVFLQQQRNNLKRISLASSRLAFVILPLMAAIWLFASITRLAFVEQVTIIAMLPIIVLTTCGRKITRALLFPLLALVLLIPFGAPLCNFLTHIFSVALLHCLGLAKLAVYWEQNKIFIAKQEYNLEQICYGLHFSSLYLTVGFYLAGYFARNIFIRLLIICNFVILPFACLFATTLSVILFSAWRNLSNMAPSSLDLVIWSALSLALICAAYCSYLMRSRSNNVYRNDGIDWRNEFANRQARWLPLTVFATLIICALPTSTYLLQNNQRFVANWHDPQSIAHDKNVALTINYDHIAATEETNSINRSWQQIRHNKLKVAVNGKIIPVTETITINKYQGKISWQLHYTNGHLTNNPVYAKVLDNMYALTKTGAKSAEITLAAELDKNLQTSRNSLKDALSELHIDS